MKVKLFGKISVVNNTKTFVSLLAILSFSCNPSSPDNAYVTNNYVLITSAIKISKESRLKFQDKFADALDSFLTKDNPLIKLDDIKLLLEEAKKQNVIAETLILSANEIDSSLHYKEKSYDMFKYMDTLYIDEYPNIFKIMEGSLTRKKDLIMEILIPSENILKLKATDVINTAKLVIKKYGIKLVSIPPGSSQW